MALFGINGYELIAGGTGSGDVNKALQSLAGAGIGQCGVYRIDPDLQNVYVAYLADYAAKHPKKSFFQEFMNPTPPAPEYVDRQRSADQEGGNGRRCHPFDREKCGRREGQETGRGLLSVRYGESGVAAIANAFHAQHKKVVVVLNIGGVIDVMQWRDQVDAILLAWQPGLEGGNAITDVLSGKVDPSGKLATTFPAKYEDVPSAKNFPGKEFPDKATTGMMGRKVVPAEVTYSGRNLCRLSVL